MELSKKFNVDGFIYASSSSVYGQNQNIKFSISDRADTPVSIYGATKRSNELIAHSYSYLYGMHTTGLRFFTVYGSWYRPDMALYKFTDKIIKNLEIDVYNNGNMKRDFTHIDDIVNGTISALNNNYKCEIFNLGNNKSEKLMDVIRIIEKKLGKSAKINYKPMQLGDVTNTYADISISKKKLNFNPKINIDDGITSLINWYKDYNNV